MQKRLIVRTKYRGDLFPVQWTVRSEKEAEKIAREAQDRYGCYGYDVYEQKFIGNVWVLGECLKDVIFGKVFALDEVINSLDWLAEEHMKRCGVTKVIKANLGGNHSHCWIPFYEREGVTVVE